jgi:hypothetical protein
MEQHGERSRVAIILFKTGAEVKNKDAYNTRIQGTHHWSRENQILSTQI